MKLNLNRGILSDILIFAAGVTIGSIVTHRYIVSKQEAIMDEDEESHWVRPTREESITEASEIIADENYDTPSDDDDIELDDTGFDYDLEEEVVELDNGPYVIAPDDLGDTDYQVDSIMFYSDGVLMTESGIPIPDDEIDDLIGKDSLGRFGEYEDDTVFVRNDRLEIDFEILRDRRTSSSATED